MTTDDIYVSKYFMMKKETTLARWYVNEILTVFNFRRELQPYIEENSVCDSQTIETVIF